MSAYVATIEWSLDGGNFTDNRYSRAHTWRFDGGVVVPASSSPQVVRLPYSDPKNVDPEEAYVAALSSCHMLWFLSIAAGRGHTVERYTDEATGFMEKNDEGRDWIARVRLCPLVIFSGAKTLSDADVRALHDAAHIECFLANSVKTHIEEKGSWMYVE